MATTRSESAGTVKTSSSGLITVAWLVVSLPLAWGIYNTALNAAKLFTHLHAAPPASQAPANTGH